MMNEGSALQHIFRSPAEINFILIVFTVAGAWVAVLMAERLVPWVANRLPGGARYRYLPWIPVLRLAIVSAAALEVLSQLIRPTTENLVAIGGGLALAVGFALKDYASDLVAGLVTLYERPYRVGDWVRVGNAYGEVKSIGFRSFQLLTPDDTVVTVPHSRIWHDNVFNANDGQSTQQVIADFYLAPHHDAAEVRVRLRDIAVTSPYLHADRPVSVMVRELAYGTHYQLKAYPRDIRSQFEFLSDMTVRGKAMLIAMGVTMAGAQVAEGIPPAIAGR